MFKNIKSTLLLNKKNFDHIKGKRFRYSPQMTWLTAIVLFAFLITIVILIIRDPGFIWYGMIGLAIFLYQLINMFHKLIFKNPIFIINNNQLFYTLNEKWYDLLKCSVNERMIGRYNFYHTLCVTGMEKDDLFQESYWYIEYDGDLKKIVSKHLDKN